jgi:hypothetical protein
MPLARVKKSNLEAMTSKDAESDDLTLSESLTLLQSI